LGLSAAVSFCARGGGSAVPVRWFGLR